MIYLFVTGKSSAYLDDIFTTLHLPCGMRHCYKYPHRDHLSNVAPDADEKACREGDTVLISYFDRTAVSAERLYIPLRYGKLNHCELSEGQLYYDVTLQEYCCASDEAAYVRYILGISGGKTRCRDENGDKKGFLVIRVEGDEDEYVQKDPEQSWSRTVRSLASRSLFQDVYPVFTKLELTNQKGEALKTITGKEYGYDLKIGKEYIVRLTYIIPTFNVDTMSSIPVKLEDSRDVCGVLQKEYFMESGQGKIEFKLCPVRKSDVLLTSLSISIQENEINQQSVRYSKKAIAVRVSDRMGKGWKYAIQAMSIIGVCVTSFLTALPYRDIIVKIDALIAKGESLTGLQHVTYDISCLLEKYCDVYSLICGIIMSVSTFFLVKFTGKAKL